MALLKYKRKNEIGECIECGSSYYTNVSEMTELCPECAHYLHGKKKCDHTFNLNRCINCYWDGSVSAQVRKLKMKIQ